VLRPDPAGGSTQRSLKTPRSIAGFKGSYMYTSKGMEGEGSEGEGEEKGEKGEGGRG